MGRGKWGEMGGRRGDGGEEGAGGPGLGCDSGRNPRAALQPGSFSAAKPIEQQGEGCLRLKVTVLGRGGECNRGAVSPAHPYGGELRGWGGLGGVGTGVLGAA